jgi:copper chaperone CopZ
MFLNIIIFRIMTKIVTFKIGMTCSGCEGAVTRILNKVEGKFVYN